MNTLGKQWAGRVFGTNTGNLFIEFVETEDGLTGTLRFMDNIFGLVIYKISGSFNGTLKIIGEPVQAPENIQVGKLEVDGALNSQGHLQGTWKTTLGTAGAFVAFPHDMASSQSSPVESPLIPEQMHIKNINLGSVRLFLDDIKQLFEFVRQDFVSGKIIVTYNFNNRGLLQDENLTSQIF